MRTYHRILLLSGVLLAINLIFQIWMLDQFLDVRQTVRDYRSNWLPSMRQAGLLSRAIRELRGLELRSLLVTDEVGLTRAARRMTRQRALIDRYEAVMRNYLVTKAERDAFAAYLTAKSAYLADHYAVLEAMGQGDHDRAVALALGASVQELATVFSTLDAVEVINQDLGVQADRNAERRFDDVLRGMLAAAAVNLLVGLVAALLTARMLSRPIDRLARCMHDSLDGPPRCPEDNPRGVPPEVASLYDSFRALSARLARSMARLEEAAVTDQLTGLANRRLLAASGERLLSLCRRTGQVCSAMLLDIDHFKAVNDTHGHAAGDDVLRHVARTLAGAARSTDLLARHGGEEFVVLLPDTDASHAAVLAERMRQALENNPAVHAGTSISSTVSIGVAQAAPDESLEALIGRADQAMYAAKQAGRNRVVVEGREGV